MFRFVSRLVDLPVIGSALYRLNVNQPMIRMMAKGHVYADPAWLDQRRLAEKLVVTNATGARHASFRFVAGELDPMSSRELFLATARRVADPILVVYGAASPDAQRQRWRRCEICRTYNPVNCPSASSRSMRNFLPLLPTPFDLLSAKNQSRE